MRNEAFLLEPAKSFTQVKLGGLEGNLRFHRTEDLVFLEGSHQSLKPLDLSIRALTCSI